MFPVMVAFNCFWLDISEKTFPEVFCHLLAPLRGGEQTQKHLTHPDSDSVFKTFLYRHFTKTHWKNTVS